MKRMIASLMTPVMLAAAAALAAPTSDNASAARDDDLFDSPQPLVPKSQRSEAEEDRLTASAWFMRGRLAYQREDHAEALRAYQRAWRADPEATSILREIVPLAFQLERNSVAARYAVIMAEQTPRDATLLRRLAQHLMDQRDYPRALALYERSLELREENDKPDARWVLAQMEIARLYFLQKKYVQAADAFDNVRDALDNPKKYELSDKVLNALLGNPRVTYMLFGESFLEAGRLEAASEMFEKAYADKASQPLLAYYLARIEMKNGRPQSALEQLDKYLLAKQTTAGTSPYELLAEAIAAGGEKAEAQAKLLAKLEKLHRDDPANAPLTYFLAEKLHAADKLDEAAAHYEAALADTPTISGYQALIEIYFQQKNIDKLLDALGKAIEQTRSLPPLGEVIDEMEKDAPVVKKLAALAKKRQKDAGDMPNADEALVVALLAVGAELYDDADEQFAVAAAADEELRPAVVESWGLQMFLAQQYDRAAKVFQKAIDDKVAPRFNADFYYYLAAALEFAGRTDEGLLAARQAAQEKDDSPRYAARYAWVLYHAKRYADAEREYKRLLEKYGDDYAEEESLDVAREARMILSNIAIHLERMPDAEEWLEQVLDEYPEDIGALNDLGYLWSDQGKHLQRSLAMVEAAVDAEPENAAYRDSLGWAHYRLGNHREAIEQLERAAEFIEETPDGVIMDHLGDAYHAGGRKKDAVKAWQQAIELFQKDDDQENTAKTQKKIDELKNK